MFYVYYKTYIYIYPFPLKKIIKDKYYFFGTDGVFFFSFLLREFNCFKFRFNAYLIDMFNICKDTDGIMIPSYQ